MPTRADMQPYDLKVQREIEDWRDRSPILPRPALPERVQQVGKDLVIRGKDGFNQLPGSNQLRDALEGALGGVVQTIGTTAAASVSHKAVLRRYTRRGHAVDRIDAIGALDLEVSDRVFPRRKRLAYMLASGGQGGAAGAAASVSEFGAVVGGVFGAGAGAVPGTLALMGVLAADAAATLGTAARIVAETAAHYGYDPSDPAEEVFLASVLSAAIAGSQGAKMVAHHEINHVAGMLARRAPKAALKQVNLARALPQIWPRLVERLTHNQMGKLIPGAGVAVGFGLNAALMKRASDEAFFAYRERRLRDLYAESGTDDVASVTGEVVEGTLVLDLLTPDEDDPALRVEAAQ